MADELREAQLADRVRPSRAVLPTLRSVIYWDQETWKLALNMLATSILATIKIIVAALSNYDDQYLAALEALGGDPEQSGRRTPQGYTRSKVAQLVVGLRTDLNALEDALADLGYAQRERPSYPRIGPEVHQR